MKKSVIFFAVFLLVLIIAVLSEGRGKDDISDTMAMGEESSTQITTSQQIPE